MGWIGCIRCEKFWCDFVARTLALIAPVQPILQQASCSNETIHNTPKHYETHQNMSLGCNGVDRLCSLQKNSDVTSWHELLQFCVVMKHCQMHPNTTRRTKTWDYGPIGWIGSVHKEKFRCDFMARTCALIAPVQPVLHWVSCSNETLPNAPKH